MNNEMLILSCIWKCKGTSRAITKNLKKNHSITKAGEGFHGGSAVKNSPAMQETWLRSLGLEDPLEKETATHSIILAWKITRIKEPSGLQSMGLQKVGHN